MINYRSFLWRFEKLENLMLDHCADLLRTVIMGNFWGLSLRVCLNYISILEGVIYLFCQCKLQFAI